MSKRPKKGEAPAPYYVIATPGGGWVAWPLLTLVQAREECRPGQEIRRVTEEIVQ